MSWVIKSTARRARLPDSIHDGWGTRSASGPGMTAEMILVWLVVGLVAGVLASMVIGSGLGMLGNIVVGVVGAFVGSWLFRAAGWSAPWHGLAGTIFVAFVGAMILLVVLRLIGRGRNRL
jgi:uncharacterized membrane protein YeaQ/YmgE (transglycosylase-associated protein family)